MHSLSRIVCVVVLTSAAEAQVFDERFDDWPVDLRINGRVMVAGQLDDLSVLATPLQRLDRRNALLIVDEETTPARIQQCRALFVVDQPADAQRPPANSESPPAASPIGANPIVLESSSVATIRRLKELLSDRHVLLWHASQQLSPEEQTALLDQRDLLRGFLAGGGTVVGIGPAAMWCAQRFASDGSPLPAATTGLDLLPDCVLLTGYTAGDRSRLLSVLAAYPRSVGIGLPDNHVLTLVGRKVTVSGPGAATFLLMANERQPIRTQALTESNSRSVANSGDQLDLTEWRRDAIDRTLPAFPAEEPGIPKLDQGTLVIVGGGGMPDGLMTRIVVLAGGPEEARMVYVPCTEEDEVSERQSTVETWKKMGVKHATFIHTKDRLRANQDEAILAPLRDATGLWFGGGRQWNFADSYYGTKAHQLMKDVLRRGGVIGGSSAGASIQARYLARATPIGNVQIMAPGYERGGLGFLDGVAIDQHFSQRGRHQDMTSLVNRYPQLLGIGIDEATAIVVQKSIANVVGRGRVHFYDRKLPVYPDRPDHVALSAGSAYELAERRIVSGHSQGLGEGENNTPPAPSPDNGSASPSVNR